MSVFPTTVPDINTFYVANNLAETALSGSVDATQTTITVAAADKFTCPCLIVVDAEVMAATSKSGNVFTVTRGFDGTTAAVHSNGAKVRNNQVAKYHNAIADEVMAIANALGANLVNVKTTTTYKATINRTALTAAATTQDITTSISVGQYEKVTGVTVKHSAAFTGGSVAAVQCSIGTSTYPALYSNGLSHSLSDAAGDGVFSDFAVHASSSMGSSSVPVVVHFESVGGNLSTLTSTATVDVWVTVTKLQ